MPKEPNAIHTRAWIYMNKGMLDLALADFDKALGLDAELAGAYADRGRAYELKGDRDKAIADYRKSLSLKSRQYYDDRAKAEALQHLTTLAAVSPAERKTAPRQSAAPSAPEKRIALVIGNGAYTNVRALKNADGDARAVAASLRQLGFEVVEKHDIGLSQLVSELKSLATARRLTIGPWSITPDMASRSAASIISSLWMRNSPSPPMSTTRPFRSIACLPRSRARRSSSSLFSMPAARILSSLRWRAHGGTRSVGRGLARVEPSSGVLVAYSARDGQVAQDGDGNNSPFAEALLDHLGEPGLEIDMLFRKVRDDVKSKTGGVQEPFTYGSLPAERLYFRAAQ